MKYKPWKQLPIAQKCKRKDKNLTKRFTHKRAEKLQLYGATINGFNHQSQISEDKLGFLARNYRESTRTMRLRVFSRE